MRWGGAAMPALRRGQAGLRRAATPALRRGQAGLRRAAIPARAGGRQGSGKQLGPALGGGGGLRPALRSVLFSLWELESPQASGRSNKPPSAADLNAADLSSLCVSCRMGLILPPGHNQRPLLMGHLLRLVLLCNIQFPFCPRAGLFALCPSLSWAGKQGVSFTS